MSNQDPYGYGAQQAPPPGYQQPARYGYQPQPPPAPKGGGCGKAALIAVVVLVGLIVAGGVIGALAGSDDDTGGETPAETADGQDVYAVGDTAHTGDFDVTVHTVTDPFAPANQFDLQPAAGNRFVAVELTMTNTSGDPLPVSTAPGIVDLTDHLDRLGSFTLAGASELPRIDTPTVAPGEARRGWVVFEVANDAAELHLRVKGNLTATGSLFRL